MSGFLSISLWVALVTVVPGLMTIAVVYCALLIGYPELLSADAFLVHSDWVIAGIAITVMVLTQALGILLEELMVRFQLFPGCSKLDIAEEFTDEEIGHIDAYKQYSGIYILLAQMRDGEDSQGHLKRALAQFFLTNNSLISFMAGIATTFFLLLRSGPNTAELGIYLISLIFFLAVSFWVATIRFRVMGKSIWATRRAQNQSID